MNASTSFAYTADSYDARARAMPLSRSLNSNLLQVGAQLPDLRKQHHVEHLAQVPHAARAARAALEADDALHGRHVAEAPEPERVFEVGELLAQLVQVPVTIRVAVHHQPRLLHLVARHVRLGPVALDTVGG